MIVHNLDTIDKNKKFSEEIFEKLQKRISKEIDSEDFCIVSTGSFSRGEASAESDLDYFVIIDENKFPNKYFKKNRHGISPLKSFSTPLNKIKFNYKLAKRTETHLDSLLQLTTY